MEGTLAEEVEVHGNSRLRLLRQAQAGPSVVEVCRTRGGDVTAGPIRPIGDNGPVSIRARGPHPCQPYVPDNSQGPVKFVTGKRRGDELFVASDGLADIAWARSEGAATSLSSSKKTTGGASQKGR